MQTSCLPYWYFGMGGLVSILYGLFCYEIHEMRRPKFGANVAHQTWFNFIGAAIGWVAGWFLGTRVLDGKFDWAVVGLLMVTIVGITGHLPKTIVGLVLAPEFLFKKMVEKAAD